MSESIEEQQNWQQKFMEFRQLQEQIEQVTEHVQKLNQAVSEIEDTRNALLGLDKAEVGSELLAPIANGIFVKSELKDAQTLTVNVGADTVVEKTVDEVVGLLEKQQEQMKQKVVEAETVLQGFHEQAMKIYAEVHAAQE